MSIIVETPDTRAPERDYILGVVLGEFLGLDWRRVPTDKTDTRITLQGHQGEIRMPDILFQTPDEDWLTPQSLPTQPLQAWDTSELGLPITMIDTQLPIIYGTVGPCSATHNTSNLKHNTTSLFYRPSPSAYRLPLDLFGSAFFMLTRYEEVVKPDRDEHDRFPAWASLAYQEDFLLRPIVDEYVEVLWAVMQCLWPGLERKKRSFQLIPTHDVDRPFNPAFQNSSRFLRVLGGDFLKRRSIAQAMTRIADLVQFKLGKIKDPFDTFDWLMDCSEQSDTNSAFYFMASKKGNLDLTYYLDHPHVSQLMQKIMERGHEIGFHPGYQAGMNGHAWHDEYQTLKNALPEHVHLQGGRQHFLRFKVPDTWRSWEQAGFAYEASLSYADNAGFRCGTSQQFPVFDLTEKAQLNVSERPLIVMECTVLDDKYMAIQDIDTAFNYILMLKNRCRIFDGQFVCLWHNSRVASDKEKEFYQNVLQG